MLAADAFRFRLDAAADWWLAGLLVAHVDRRYRVSDPRACWLGATWLCADVELGKVLMTVFATRWSAA